MGTYLREMPYRRETQNSIKRREGFRVLDLVPPSVPVQPTVKADLSNTQEVSRPQCGIATPPTIVVTAPPALVPTLPVPPVTPVTPFIPRVPNPVLGERWERVQAHPALHAVDELYPTPRITYVAWTKHTIWDPDHKYPQWCYDMIKYINDEELDYYVSLNDWLDDVVNHRPRGRFTFRSPEETAHLEETVRMMNDVLNGLRLYD